MTDLVLSTRHGNGAVAHPAQPAQPLAEIERICNMIATGGEMVPPAYRGKPGAVLLAKLWADANRIDLFTAMQNISPIEGKPYVSAEMRVQMAVAKGFEFRVIQSTREVCTLQVVRAGEVLGEVTCSIGDQERKLRTSSGKPTSWANHPDDMLFAEACRKADRRFVRTAAALLDAGQDYDAAMATVDALTDALPGEPITADPEWEIYDSPGDGEFGVRSPDVVVVEPEPDDEMTDATAAAISDVVTVADLLAAAKLHSLTRVKLMRHAQLALGWSGGVLDDIEADQHVATLLLAAIGAGEVQ
jgi:hypothetical protein